jgi:hypothetical protein
MRLACRITGVWANASLRAQRRGRGHHHVTDLKLSRVAIGWKVMHRRWREFHRVEKPQLLVAFDDPLLKHFSSEPAVRRLAYCQVMCVTIVVCRSRMVDTTFTIAGGKTKSENRQAGS